jgi:outer membrane protein
MKNHKVLRSSIVFAFLVMACVGMQAQATEPISLDVAVQKALAARLEMKVLEHRSLGTEKELKANELRYIPQLSAQADIRYNVILATNIVPIGALTGGSGDQTVAVRFGTNWANGAGLNLRQTIFDPTIKGARESAILNGKLVDAQKEQTAEAITVEVARAYYALLIAEAEVANGLVDSSLASQRLQDLRLRVAAGRALQIDVESLRIDSATAALRLADIRRNAADWRAVLAYQMGIGARNGSVLRTATTLPEMLKARTSSAAAAQPYDSPEYQIKALQAERSLLLQANEKAGYKPDLSINGYLGANHFSNTFDIWKGSQWFPISYIGVNLTVPLTEGFIRKQRVQGLGITAYADALEREAAKAQTELEFERAMIALDGAEQALAAQDAIEQLAIQKWAITQARAAQERATNTEVATALADLQHAQTMRLRRVYELLLADLEMRRVCGMLRF